MANWLGLEVGRRRWSPWVAKKVNEAVCLGTLEDGGWRAAKGSIVARKARNLILEVWWLQNEAIVLQVQDAYLISTGER